MSKNISTPRPSELTATDNASNDIATATLAAPTDGSLFITYVSAAFSGTAPAGTLLVLNDGGTEIMRWYVRTDFETSFDSPVKIAQANNCTLVLSAGGAGIVGAVNLAAFVV